MCNCRICSLVNFMADFVERSRMLRGMGLLGVSQGLLQLLQRGYERVSGRPVDPYDIVEPHRHLHALDHQQRCRFG
jgi:hypothetical protein